MAKGSPISHDDAIKDFNIVFFYKIYVMYFVWPSYNVSKSNILDKHLYLYNSDSYHLYRENSRGAFIFIFKTKIIWHFNFWCNSLNSAVIFSDYHSNLLANLQVC